MSLVLVPVTGSELAGWLAQGWMEPALAFTAGPQFLDAFGLDSANAEDAEYTLLHLAGVECLLGSQPRLVAVAEDAGSPASDEFGRYEPGRLRWSGVTAVFAEGSPGLADATAAAVAGLDLGQAWDHPTVETLLRHGDLLWHGRDESGRLVEAQRKG